MFLNLLPLSPLPICLGLSFFLPCFPSFLFLSSLERALTLAAALGAQSPDGLGVACVAHWGGSRPGPPQSPCSVVQAFPKQPRCGSESGAGGGQEERELTPLLSRPLVILPSPFFPQGLPHCNITVADTGFPPPVAVRFRTCVIHVSDRTPGVVLFRQHGEPSPPYCKVRSNISGLARRTRLPGK